MSDSAPKCFGFFLGNATCGQCAVQKSCKAILLSSGFDLGEAVIDNALANLPEDGEYFGTPSISALAAQLLGEKIDPNESEQKAAEAKQAFMGKAKKQRGRKAPDATFTPPWAGGQRAGKRVLNDD